MAVLLLALFVAQARAQAPTRMPTASPHGPSLTSCNDCHTSSGWKPLRNIIEFDHNKTAFPLRQLHTQVACKQCHTKLVFNKADTRCATCHADLHRGQMGSQCERCHTTKGWRESVSQLQSHQNVRCTACHKNSRQVEGKTIVVYKPTPSKCVDCHRAAIVTAETSAR